MVSACVIPPDLEPDDGDAGTSSPPLLVEAGPAPDFSLPGPITFTRPETRTMSLTLRDNDLTDVLYIRLFVDYGRPNATPFQGDCQAPPSGQVQRLTECSVSSLCQFIPTTDLGDHYLEAVVSDRPFIADSDPAAIGQPPYRAVEDVRHAASSIGSWIMRCAADDGI
jgi:hypothetical protein